LRLLRLRTALAWFEFAPGQPLDARKKAIASERPSNALTRAQAFEQILVGLAANNSANVRPSSAPRRCARVLDHRQSCARSAPAPG
jgi:hypothetical protein